MDNSSITSQSLWIYLSKRLILRLRGKDTRSFLQGLVTQDVSKDTVFFSAILTPAGRFHSDFFLVELEEDEWFLEYHQDHKNAILEVFKKFQPFHEIEIEEVSHRVYVSIGDCPPVPEDAISFKDPRNPDMGWRCLSPVELVQWENGEFLYHQHRLALQIPEGSEDLISGKSIILSYAYHHLNAISWTKGCYMGQELMARTYHRGEIRYKPYLLTGGGTFPKKGTPLALDRERVGIMGSCYGSSALAILNKDLLPETSTWSRGLTFTALEEDHPLSFAAFLTNSRW